MYRYRLTTGDVETIKLLIGRLAKRYRNVEDPDLACQVMVYIAELPVDLRHFLNRFRLEQIPEGLAVISGYPIDFKKIGRTPENWDVESMDSPALEEEIFLFLCGSVLGDVFGWATQQGGRLVHNVIPIQGHECQQLGSSSLEPLAWHTEDAFHSCAGDYVGLMCLRNPNRVATVIGFSQDLKLDSRLVATLFEPRFVIRPDNSHLQANRANSSGKQLEADRLQASYQRMEEMRQKAERKAVLFGDPSSPYIRIDPYFMDSCEEDHEASRALQALIEEIESNLFELVLEPGDLAFVDNYRAVHGRKSFKPRYDGQDRWLKRINVTRDLRKSRSHRKSPTDRIIY